MGIYIKGDFKNPYPNCDKCIFGELIQCEAVTRREVYDYDVDCPLSEIEVSDDAISREWLETNFQTVCENVRCNKCPFENDDCRLIKFIVDAPSVVSSRAEGEWITAPDSYEIICSKCECEAFSDYGEYIKTDYCPNCGKKMKG